MIFCSLVACPARCGLCTPVLLLLWQCTVMVCTALWCYQLEITHSTAATSQSVPAPSQPGERVMLERPPGGAQGRTDNLEWWHLTQECVVLPHLSSQVPKLPTIRTILKYSFCSSSIELSSCELNLNLFYPHDWGSVSPLCQNVPINWILRLDPSHTHD